MEKIGVIHRDLKPTNIMMDSVSFPGALLKYVDFGEAKEQLNQTLTLNTIVGTPSYLSPEMRLAMQVLDQTGKFPENVQ